MVTKDVIDLSNQSTFDAEDFKDSLVSLRRLIFDNINGSMDVGKLFETLYVLNWLIEDVDYIDSKQKDK
jgi:hypothetical protein